MKDLCVCALINQSNQVCICIQCFAQLSVRVCSGVRLEHRKGY